MILGRRVLAVVPARGGSKGVLRKNLRLLHGRPLVEWTLLAARESRTIDRFVVSSEDEEILDLARKWGPSVAFPRPAELAGDDTPGIAPVLHVLETIDEAFDIVLLLQPTSPLRTADDIDDFLQWMAAEQIDSAVSVSKVEHPLEWVFSIDPAGTLVPLLGGDRPSRRQDAPVCYRLNGALYGALIPWLIAHRTFLDGDTRARTMPPERSFDVDTELDLIVCEALLSARRNEQHSLQHKT